MNGPSPAQPGWMIAVDGGGSKIAIAAARCDLSVATDQPPPHSTGCQPVHGHEFGSELGQASRAWHFEGTGSAHPSTWPQAAQNLVAAIEEVLSELQEDPQQIVSIQLALAGAGRAEDQERVIDTLRAHCPHLAHTQIACTGDIEPLVDFHPHGIGCVAVILGTGSIVASRHSDGTLVRAGGWGPLLGDACSGGAIGLSALRYLTQLIDEGKGQEQLMELAEALVRELRKLDDHGQLTLNSLIIQTANDRARTARLANVLLDHAYRLADRTALELLEQHLAEIVWQIRQVTRHAGLNDQPLQLNFTGGIAEHHPELRHAIVQACSAAGLRVTSLQLVQPLQAMLRRSL